ncbi:unnamed protein product [Symbiodinium natans]|uniref:Uncharacterized protein n=1 Tax=Symbiodinium natans TaxID=878477 RepID=A0A812HLK4_9DINO|nr:unnamed protein product [Symbiodinium natans]
MTAGWPPAAVDKSLEDLKEQSAKVRAAYALAARGNDDDLVELFRALNSHDPPTRMAAAGGLAAALGSDCTGCRELEESLIQSFGKTPLPWISTDYIRSHTGFYLAGVLADMGTETAAPVLMSYVGRAADGFDHTIGGYGVGPGKMVLLQMMEYQKQDIDERWFADERYVQGGFFGTRLLGAPATHVQAAKALGFLAPASLGHELIEQSLRICIKAVVDMEMELRGQVKEVDQEDGAFCAGALLGWLRFTYRFPASPPPAQAVVALTSVLAAARKMMVQLDRRIAKLWPIIQKSEELLRRYGEEVEETRLIQLDCRGCFLRSDLSVDVVPWVQLHRSGIPAAGLGLAGFERNDRATALACEAFLQVRGRLFDTAFSYQQQRGIHAAVIAKALPRSAVTIISKVPLGEAEEVAQAISKTAEELGGLQGIESLGNDLMFDLLLIAARPLGRSEQQAIASEPVQTLQPKGHLEGVPAAGLAAPCFDYKMPMLDGRS